ncbi:spermidine/putrescine ABC transporter substrate-binding protein [Candidatus Babeliales bacterium]|nr:spermidine/putrescine ABC transporter substrate-binding protein [Candidatus Babeliales bacterium]
MNHIYSFFKEMMAVVMWTALFFGFLFSPRIMQSFKTDKSINICIWSGIIDPQLFKKFEKETGIHVNVSYFEGNEELLVKLLATKGKGYDLVSPSDYVVDFLRINKLLQRIDRSKLDFYDDLNPKMLGHYFDPLNEYSVPSEWYIQGLGINTQFFKHGLPQASWATLFNPLIMPNHLGLLNDSRELIGLAIKYKYDVTRPMSHEEIQEIKKILVAQKKRAEAYTDFRGDFLLESGNCSLIVVANSIIWKTVKENPRIVYLIPEEGTFLNIENYVIPAVSKKAEYVYTLMNFLFRPEHQIHNFYEYGSLLSTRKDADYMFNTPELKDSVKFIHPDSELHVLPYQNFLTDDQVNEIWLAVKGE